MDRIDQQAHQPSPTGEATIRALLLTMADRLNNEAQDEPMTEKGRLDLARELAGRDTDLHTALLAASVHVAPEATRAEYAAVLLAVADTLDLVNRFAAANQTCRDIAQRVGVRECDDSQEWRDAETECNRLWDLAHEGGHSSATLLAAGKAKAAS
ncbi:hypothetical protein [Streptomyces sp. NPDC005302]|uniref:hypothetical protein n=1 Tax=Streptomyces sp. NPDC005302 TaxID=3154675 RepID=UPI0033B5E8F5